MVQLREMLTGLGFSQVGTILASGNAVFNARGLAAPALEALLEREAAARLGLRTDFFVRSAEEIAALISHNPFTETARERPAQLVVAFGRVAVPTDLPGSLAAFYDGPERISVSGREMYIDFPHGQGRSKLWPAVAKLKLAGLGTARNWNTVAKLHQAANGPDAPDPH